MCWASAPGWSPEIVATTCRGRSAVSSAQSTTTPRDRSQPSRPARRTISRGAEVRARADVLEERAAQVLLDLLARLLDRDLGQRGDRGDVEELGGVGRAACARRAAAGRRRPGPRRSRSAPRRRPRRGHLGRAAADLLADVAAELLERVLVAARRPRPPSPRAAARRSRPARRRRATASAATCARPSPPSTASTIARWTSRRRATSSGRRRLRPGAGAAGPLLDPAAPSTVSVT